MNRRRLLVGLGGLAGASGVLGTGAFTSVSANRSVSVAVTNDSDALLALSPCDGANGDYVTGAGSGVMEVDLSSTNQQVLGDGVNANAQTVIDDVFEIKNQGTQPVGVWLQVNPVVHDGTERVQFRVTEGGSGSIVGQGNAVCLGVGDSVCVGLVIDTRGIDAAEYGNLLQQVQGTDHEMVVNADADAPCVADGIPIEAELRPLAHYRFDGDATDATGNGFDGTNQGATFPGTSRVGTAAASFDGMDDYVVIEDSPGLGLTDAFSLTAWIRPDPEIDDYARVVSRESSGVGNRQYNLGLDSTATYPRTVVDTVTQGAAAVVGTTDVVDGDWHHVATTFDAGDGLKLYVDGTEEDVATVSSPLVSSSSDVTVGAPAHLPAKDHFDGLIDDLRIYDRALSTGDVQTLAGSP